MVKLKNKNRLYLAVSGSRLTDRTPRLYWGFLIGPKIEDKSINQGMHFGIAKDDEHDGRWNAQTTHTQSVQSTPGVLARVLFAKIEDDQHLVDLLREPPLASSLLQGGDGEDDDACRSLASRRWAEQILARLAMDGKIVGTAQLEWEKVHVTARAYVGKKIAEDRYREEERMVLPTATWDMLSGRELVP